MSDSQESGVSRRRFEGDVVALSEVIAKYAVNPLFMPYDDTFKGARLQPSLIVRNAGMWDELHSLCPNFCWSRSQASAVMQAVIDKKEWLEMNGAEKKKWSETLGHPSNPRHHPTNLNKHFDMHRMQIVIWNFSQQAIPSRFVYVLGVVSHVFRRTSASAGQAHQGGGHEEHRDEVVAELRVGAQRSCRWCCSGSCSS